MFWPNPRILELLPQTPCPRQLQVSTSIHPTRCEHPEVAKSLPIVEITMSAFWDFQFFGNPKPNTFRV